MNIMAIGDVVAGSGCAFLRKHLPALKKIHAIDIVIANGENSADGNGITPHSAKYLFDSGVDVITGGNHSFRRNEMFTIYESDPFVLRPANYPDGTAGTGLCIVDRGRVRVGVISLMGNVFLGSLRCPFETMDNLLATPDLPKICFVDFHAEATGEKKALGYYLDGRVTAVFGTHTHVATSDASILPKGTGYITDLGMTGAAESVLGVKPEIIIRQLKGKLPVRFENADGPNKMDCTIFEVDESTSLCKSVQSMTIS